MNPVPTNAKSLPEPLSQATSLLLRGILALYIAGRISQLFAPVLPTILVVLLHVIPPALFALVHGTRLYRLRGFLMFSGCCLLTGAVSESLSLGTGFPFGRYTFTSVMGPKILGLPILLVLAYLGIGYSSWILALLITRTTGHSPRAIPLFTLPALAAAVMTCWDLTMDPEWATLDRAWIWRRGGPWFGVPVSNYVGWLLTCFIFYLLFVLYLRLGPFQPEPQKPGFWRSAAVLYAVCALGNLLILFQPMVPSLVADPTGKIWQTSHILLACILCSLFAMLPIAVLAWLRTPPALNGRPNSQVK